MQPCVHDSEFGEHLWESLKMMDATVLFMTGLKMLCAFQFRISDWTHESREDSLYSLSNKRLSHSEVSSKISMVVGVPTLVCEYSECFGNSLEIIR